MAFLVTLVACGGGEDSADYAFGTFLSDQQVVDAEFAYLRAAEEDRAACMNDAGFDFRPFVGNSVGTVYELALTSPVDLDPDVASERGYGVVALSRQTSDAVASDPNRLDFASQAEADAFNNSLSECSEAGASSMTLLIDRISEVQRIVLELSPAVLMDARLSEGLAEWTECMRRDGYDFPSPLEAQNHIFEQLEGLEAPDVDSTAFELRLDGVEAEEITLAMSDAGCRESWLADLNIVREEHEDRLVTQNRELFDSILELIGLS